MEKNKAKNTAKNTATKAINATISLQKAIESLTDEQLKKAYNNQLLSATNTLEKQTKTDLIALIDACAIVQNNMLSVCVTKDAKQAFEKLLANYFTVNGNAIASFLSYKTLERAVRRAFNSKLLSVKGMDTRGKSKSFADTISISDFLKVCQAGIFNRLEKKVETVSETIKAVAKQAKQATQAKADKLNDKAKKPTQAKAKKAVA